MDVPAEAASQGRAEAPERTPGAPDSGCPSRGDGPGPAALLTLPARGLSTAGERLPPVPSTPTPGESQNSTHREQLPAESHPHGAEQALDRTASPAPTPVSPQGN